MSEAQVSEKNYEPRLTADELLNLAIMTKSPVFIVEGWDDIPVYKRIAKEADVKCQIFASESLEEEKSGCVGVIENIKKIRQVAVGFAVEKHILGIIDRDARAYRNEVPDDPAIMTLAYNSIESHYVNADTVRFVLPKFTRADVDLIGPETCEDICSKIFEQFDFLYYVSLEALKNACDPDYDALFGYKHTITAITKQNFHQAVLDRKEHLDRFASDHNLTYTIETLLMICKGKWLSDTFFELLHKKLSDLPALCGAAKIPQCQLCKFGSRQHKCLYSKIVSYTPGNLYADAIQNDKLTTLSYISARFGSFNS